MLNSFSPNALPSNNQVVTSAATIQKYTVQRRSLVKKLMFVIGTTIVSPSNSVVLTFYRRPTFNSTSGRVSLGTITIPAGATAGKFYQCKITPVKVVPGEEIEVAVTTQAAGSGAAGSGHGTFELEDLPEVAANESNVVEVTS